MTPTLQEYLKAFARLKRCVPPYVLAPDKPAQLLSLIEQIDNGLVTNNNQFEVNADLVATFKENWLLLVQTLHQENFAQPFYYLQSEKAEGKPYWLIQSNLGMQINAHIKSATRLSETCAFGCFDSELFELLTAPVTGAMASNFILNTYFANEKPGFLEAKYNGKGYLHDQEEFILNERQGIYKKVIINTEEDVFVRNGLFKKLVPKIYNYQCSFTGMQLSSTFNHSFVDACHIVPFNQTQND
ncbi:hypothetical protein [Pedobacter sp. BMA]|uniref:hypothetical protein n=1 Tax=Pedobacter sp. BMA TaxID=1663685 RepID=UPI00069EDD7D|nr:hypothetical protein [Pedobacter sp. BMA]